RAGRRLPRGRRSPARRSGLLPGRRHPGGDGRRRPLALRAQGRHALLTQPPTSRRVKLGWPVAAVRPPSTTIIAPVTYAAPFAAGTPTRGAPPPGRPTRPIGIRRAYSAEIAGWFTSAAASGVSIGPGHTALTRIPSGAWSMASVRV